MARVLQRQRQIDQENNEQSESVSSEGSASDSHMGDQIDRVRALNDMIAGSAQNAPASANRPDQGQVIHAGNYNLAGPNGQ